MGVTGLINFLETKFPEVFSRVRFSKFAYKKICFDVSSYMYKFISCRGREENGWLNPFINMLMFFRANAVNVTFVFDGVAPPEKDEERADRLDQKEKADDKAFNLSLGIMRYKQCGEKYPILIESMKALAIKKRNAERNKPKRLLGSSKKVQPEVEPPEIDDDVEIDIAALEELLEQKERNNFGVTEADGVLLRNLFEQFKVPYIIAKNEAEATCNDLVKRGLADATFSVDSDCLAYQVPIVINDLDISTGLCRIVELDKLCEILDFEPEQVTLFSILCGCDYNRYTKNIRGAGPVTAYKLVKQYKTLEAMESAGKLPRKNLANTDNGLRHARCVELFNLTYPEITKVDVWDLSLDLDKLGKFLISNKLLCDMERVKMLWTPPKIIIEETPAEESHDEHVISGVGEAEN